MSRKKIFYLDHSTDFSGGQKSLLALLTRLDLSIFDPLVIIDEKASTLAGELQKIKINFIKINYLNDGLKGRFLFPVVALRLYFLIKKKKCDLLHCNTFKVGFLCALLSFILSVPIIFRSRLGIVVNSHGIVDRIIYNFSTVILANSHYVKQTYFERFNKSEKIKVVYNPLFLDYSLKEGAINDLKLKYFRDPSCFYFGSIGRIESFKRQHEIVEAVRILSRKREDFKVIFFGKASEIDGMEYERHLKSLIASYHLEKFFLFAGFVMDINEATSLLDCVVLCTEGEPLSRGIFESQFLKVPVIASDSGGNPELIQDYKTGLLYEINNPESLSGKMQEIIEDSTLREKIVANAYEFVFETFDPAKTVRQEENVYRKLLRMG